LHCPTAVSCQTTNVTFANTVTTATDKTNLAFPKFQLDIQPSLEAAAFETFDQLVAKAAMLRLDESLLCPQRQENKGILGDSNYNVSKLSFLRWSLEEI
jgi:hypothetical protein